MTNDSQLRRIGNSCCVGPGGSKQFERSRNIDRNRLLGYRSFLQARLISGLDPFRSNSCVHRDRPIGGYLKIARCHNFFQISSFFLSDLALSSPFARFHLHSSYVKFIARTFLICGFVSLRSRTLSLSPGKF